MKQRLDQLPAKGKRYLPYFYWVHAPTHTHFSADRNRLRVKFNLGLESVIRSQKDMRVIRLKQHWQAQDTDLVVNNKITEVGMSAYWNAIDASVQFNSKCRELFLVKALLATVQKDSSEVPENQRIRASNSASRHDKYDDPMQDLFRRQRRQENNYEGFHMETREDFHSRSDQRRRYNDRFILPHPRS